jgi:hypothetical protein
LARRRSRSATETGDVVGATLKRMPATVLTT